MYPGSSPRPSSRPSAQVLLFHSTNCFSANQFSPQLACSTHRTPTDVLEKKNYSRMALLNVKVCKGHSGRTFYPTHSCVVVEPLSSLLHGSYMAPSCEKKTTSASQLDALLVVAVLLKSSSCFICSFRRSSLLLAFFEKAACAFSTSAFSLAFLSITGAAGASSAIAT